MLFFCEVLMHVEFRQDAVEDVLACSTASLLRVVYRIYRIFLDVVFVLLCSKLLGVYRRLFYVG